MATSVPVSKLDASELSLIARALDLLCKSLERAKRANSGAVQAAFAGELNHANSVLSKVRNLELEV